jgi:hypothetical protein
MNVADYKHNKTLNHLIVGRTSEVFPALLGISRTKAKIKGINL